jgi:glycosyltransferase involved in cell wall biosynthesis
MPLEPHRILIVADSASAKFGGEAALALHYFRVLRKRQIPVWLITHARTRAELAALYGADPRILYIEDTWFHILMWKLSQRIPAAIGSFTTGFLSRLAVQLEQRRLVRALVRDEQITAIHQPMPVSPREPSMLFGFGVPVLIGPMNGGMEYPPAFKRQRGNAEAALLRFGRWSSGLLNWLIPGKRRAATLLVANRRTADALPPGACNHVVELVENGVDLGLWEPDRGQAEAAPLASASGADPTTFVFMGRLVGWKAVNLLLDAFAQASTQAPMRLLILGDGEQRVSLQAHAAQLRLRSPEIGQDGVPIAFGEGQVAFAGWQPQAVCARRLVESDCLVLPSLLECGGAVVLEAMSLAKPVIATAWGGPLDYLDDTCGILIPPSDAAALVAGFAQAMVRLAQAPKERAEMGRNGQAKVRRLYDWETKVDRMLEQYAKAGQVHRAGQTSSAIGR